MVHVHTKYNLNCHTCNSHDLKRNQPRCVKSIDIFSVGKFPRLLWKSCQNRFPMSCLQPHCHCFLDSLREPNPTDCGACASDLGVAEEPPICQCVQARAVGAADSKDTGEKSGRNMNVSPSYYFLLQLNKPLEKTFCFAVWWLPFLYKEKKIY